MDFLPIFKHSWHSYWKRDFHLGSPFFFSNLDGLHSVNSRSTSQGVPSTSPCYAGQAFLALPSISITWARKNGEVGCFTLDNPSCPAINELDLFIFFMLIHHHCATLSPLIVYEILLYIPYDPYWFILIPHDIRYHPMIFNSCPHPLIWVNYNDLTVLPHWNHG